MLVVIGEYVVVLDRGLLRELGRGKRHPDGGTVLGQAVEVLVVLVERLGLFGGELDGRGVALVLERRGAEGVEVAQAAGAVLHHGRRGPRAGGDEALEHAQRNAGADCLLVRDGRVALRAEDGAVAAAVELAVLAAERGIGADDAREQVVRNGQAEFAGADERRVAHPDVAGGGVAVLVADHAGGELEQVRIDGLVAEPADAGLDGAAALGRAEDVRGAERDRDDNRERCPDPLVFHHVVELDYEHGISILSLVGRSIVFCSGRAPRRSGAPVSGEKGAPLPSVPGTPPGGCRGSPRT